MRKRLDDLFALLMLAFGVAAVLAGGWCLAHSIDRARAEAEPIPVASVHIELPQPSLEPALAPAQEPLPTPTPAPYDPDVPLSLELQLVLDEVCAETGVPVALALGLIEVESGFQADAVSPSGCVGLCQLNPLYFPDELSPADNIRYGVRHLGELLERYGDTAAALTSYNAGHDTGARSYAGAVLAAAERWGELCT